MNNIIHILKNILNSGLYTDVYDNDDYKNHYYIFPITKTVINNKIVESFKIDNLNLEVNFNKKFLYEKPIKIKITSSEYDIIMYLYKQTGNVYKTIRTNSLKFLFKKNLIINQKYLSIESKLQEYFKNKELDIIRICVDSANTIHIEYYLPNFENNVLEVKILKVSIEEDPYLYYKFIETLFNY